MLEVLLSASRKSDQGAGFGIFTHGSASASNGSDKYQFKDDVVTTSTSLGVGLGHGGASLGNYTFGMFAGGTASSVDTATARKYTYASNVVSTITNLGLARMSPVGCGNNDVGIVTGGQASSTIQRFTDLYNHSNNSRVSGTQIGAGRIYMSSAGNSDVCVFAGGFSTTNRVDKYTYSTQAFVQSTSLVTPRYGSGAGSLPTHGYFFGGHGGAVPTTTVEIFDFASNVVSQGVNAGIGSGYISSTGNNKALVLMPSPPSTLKYNYANRSVTPGTSLKHSRAMAGATCSSPGGF